MNRTLRLSMLCLAALSAAQAQADTTVSIGLRAWVNDWTSWDVYPPLAVPGGSLPGASENFTSGSKVAAIPSLSVRHGDWLFSASHFVRTRYSFDGSDAPFSARRSESDVLAGFYVLPTLALTLGYKEVKQDFGNNARFTYSGPLLGMAGSAPLTAGFSLYGNVGLGRMKAKLPLQDAAGRSRLDADYMLGEVGIAYSLNAASWMPGAKAMSVTLGYRSQVLATKDFRIAQGLGTGAKSRGADLRDTTEGLTLGLGVSF